MTRGSFVLRAGLLAALPLATCLCGVALATPSQPVADPGEKIAAIEVNLEPAAWTDDLDCTACHKKEAAAAEELKGAGTTESSDAPTSLVETHAALDFACSTCHYDEETLSALHESPNPKKKVRRLKHTEVAEELCLSCHDAAALAEATQDLGLLVDKEGLESQPDLPDVSTPTSLARRATRRTRPRSCATRRWRPAPTATMRTSLLAGPATSRRLSSKTGRTAARPARRAPRPGRARARRPRTPGRLPL